MPTDNSGPGFAGPLGYPAPTRVPDFWQPAGAPIPVSSLSSATRGKKKNPNVQVPAPPRSDTETTNKRDSDPIIQEKVRQAQIHGPHGQARGVSARTQSLDITSLNFSRALAGGGGQNNFGPIPPSPSPGVGGMASSPNTATGQFFPHSHAVHPLHPNMTGKGYYETQLDVVTQGTCCTIGFSLHRSVHHLLQWTRLLEADAA